MPLVVQAPLPNMSGELTDLDEFLFGAVVAGLQRSVSLLRSFARILKNCCLALG